MGNTAVIYMTTYYKEKASFYFTFYHELMHINRDFNMLKTTTIVDDNEKDIDKMALEEMIPSNIYEAILKDDNNRDTIAKNNNIPLCFLYTRLAKEGIIDYNSKDYLNNRESIDNTQ